MKTLYCLLALIATSVQALEVPALKARVNDYGNVLSSSERASLEETLKAQEDKTSNQIVILTIPSLEGENREAFAQKVFDTWKLGQKGKDNGVLILQAVKEREIRIQVGDGLEGRLTDAQSGWVIRETMVPKFKAGQFAEGYSDAIATVNKVIAGEFTAPAEDNASGSKAEAVLGSAILILCVVGIAGIIHWALGGAAGAVMGLIIGVIMALPGSLILICAIVGFILGVIIGKIARKAADEGVFDNIGSDGGTYSSRSSGGGSSGYSGGGGSSSGGGAGGRY